MDDLKYGSRNKRGDWAPTATLKPAPIWRKSPSFKAILAWLPDYFLPWNLLYMALATVLWFWMTPDIETLKSLAPGWIVYLLLRNTALVLIIYGATEYFLYNKRTQENRFKFNGKWPVDNQADYFFFNSQNKDNILRTFGTGVPIWTAYEVLLLSAYANEWGAWSTLGQHPVWFVVFWLLIPAWHEFHFYCIHRLIHTPFLYKHIHSVHHNSINPSPWSSLSMHPLEQLLYWSDSLIHFVLPSHPLIALYNLQATGTGAMVGHIGFDKIEVGENTVIKTHSYTHYLHHKFFEVNYGDGLIPIDLLAGTWHDGSQEGDERLRERMRKLKVKAKSKSDNT